MGEEMWVLFLLDRMHLISGGRSSTTMTEYLAHSEAGKKWTPWVPSVFGTEVHVPLERPAGLVLTLALGKADALSGRFVSVFDDIDVLMERAEEIEQNDLYTMRFRK